MKTACGAICVAGLVILAASVGWWFLHRGEVMDEVDLQRTERMAVVGKVEVGKTVAADLGKRFGPYSLTPADNPVQLAVVLDTSRATRHEFPREAFVLGAMYDADGNEVWSDRHRITQTVKRKHLKKKLPTVKTFKKQAIIEIKKIPLSPITIEKPGKYTFLCGVETVPESWVKVHRSSFDVKVILRKNAQPFPLVWGLLGLALVVLGAVPYGKLVTREQEGQPEPSGPVS